MIPLPAETLRRAASLRRRGIDDNRNDMLGDKKQEARATSAGHRERGETLRQVCSLLTCLLMMLAVAVNRDGRMLGHSFSAAQENVTPTATTADDVVSTAEAGRDIVGYAGPTPVTILIDDGVITAVTAEANKETPEFFGAVENRLLPRWVGMTVDEALSADIDAVSGATISSYAVIKNVRLGLQIYKDAAVEAPATSVEDIIHWHSPKFICTVLVILAAAIVPFRIKSRRYRTLQLLLNVIVLGLWSGTFLSYSLIVSTLSNGLNAATAVTTVLLLVIAFVYPLIGKKKHYCFYVCPMGSLQELASMTVSSDRRKRILTRLGITQRLMKRLSLFREILWAVLMLLMWSGVWFSWMDYELFTAFIFNHAAPALIATAALFAALSCILPRPYCHFVCPTGTLLRTAGNTK